MKQRNISMSEETWERVKKTALRISMKEGEAVSASEIVRRAVEDYLRRHEPGEDG